MTSLDSNFTALVKDSIYSTWSAIGADCYDLDPDMDNEEMMEMCIDAGRLEAYGGRSGKEANAHIRTMVAEHGYEKVLQFLSKHLLLGY